MSNKQEFDFDSLLFLVIGIVFFGIWIWSGSSLLSQPDVGPIGALIGGFFIAFFGTLLLGISIAAAWESGLIIFGILVLIAAGIYWVVTSGI